MKVYIFFIGLKIIFLGLILVHLYLKYKTDRDELDNKIIYWKNRVEFIFVTCMALLMVYVFNPRSSVNVVIDNEMKVLFFIFGLLLLFTENWGIFLNESKLITLI